MTTISTINLFLALLVISGAGGACSTTIGERSAMNRAGAQPTSTPNATTTAGHSIRSIDFANSTYPAQYVFTHGPKDFTLVRGRFSEDETEVRLAYLDFGDVNGDGAEEALVVLAPILTGSATPLVVYIYTLKDTGLQLLWAFSSGDRADGGLRRVYAESGLLVVERFSPIKSNGACCPTQFSRTTYAWDGASFRQRGPVETIPNSTGNSDTLMSEYQRENG